MKKQSTKKVFNTEEFFNIGLVLFGTALQMPSGLVQLSFYLAFVFVSIRHLYELFVKYKQFQDSKYIYILELVRSLSLAIGLTVVGLAFSLNSLWLYALSTALFVLYAGIVWSFWSLRFEER